MSTKTAEQSAVKTQGEISYPIAEIFESVQGEGGQAGIAMTFVRLAGCTVGKPYTAEARKALGLEYFQERCVSWDGASFPCDTNYRMSSRKTVAELMAMDEIKNAHYVSITGGEPLMHNLVPLMVALDVKEKHIHIETSGTVALPANLIVDVDLARQRTDCMVWVTVSPKQGCLPEMLKLADEIRIMVDKDFNEGQFLLEYEKYIADEKVWISPVNDLVTLNIDNMKRCLALQQRYRQLRLSIQQHKIWGVR